jgi:hypothetical protein
MGLSAIINNVRVFALVVLVLCGSVADNPPSPGMPTIGRMPHPAFPASENNRIRHCVHPMFS